MDSYYKSRRGEKFITSKIARIRVSRRRLLSRCVGRRFSDIVTSINRLSKEARYYRKLKMKYCRFWAQQRQIRANIHTQTPVIHSTHSHMPPTHPSRSSEIPQTSNLSRVRRSPIVHNVYRQSPRCFSSTFRPHVHIMQRTNALSLDRIDITSNISNGSSSRDYTYTTYHPHSSRSTSNANPRIRRGVPFNSFGAGTVHIGNTDINRSRPFDGLRTFVSRRRNITERLTFSPRNVKCPNCGAKMWLDEKTKESSVSNPTFNLCCQSGQVKLPLLPNIPNYLKNLLRNSRFREKIRPYNATLKFTSTGGKIDTSVLEGRGPYVYRISGENWHRIGSLMPPINQPPKFAQLYIYDTEHEIRNRMSIFNGNRRSSNLDSSVLSGLRTMLGETNPYVQVFQYARDMISTYNQRDFHIKLLNSREGRQYTMPTTNEVAALIVGDGTEPTGNRDIIVRKIDGTLQRIYETHPSYMPLQYPLIFPYGTDGWRLNIALAPGARKGKRSSVSMREFYAFRMQNRDEEETSVNDFGRLSQQYHVDSYAAVEEDRLFFYKTHQNEMRADLYRGLQDAIASGDTDASRVGRKFILPSSFTGGHRNMIQHYQDAVAICRAKGYPDLFITFTCNPRWPDILEDLQRYPNQHSVDIANIVARTFQRLKKQLLRDLKDSQFFGQTIADMHVIEFQKRGLPHTHIILTLAPSAKLELPEQIDDIICAEIPDEENDPLAFETVMRCMIHGPCGSANPSSPCMVNGKCSKRYPKNFNDVTTTDERGFVIYRRRNTGKTWKVNGFDIDNRWVVPYNRDLIVRYDAHINVERCVPGKLIKYLYLYVTKGSDRATAAVVDDTNHEGDRQRDRPYQNDEIKQYLDCRYVSAIEACWRLLDFRLQKQNPTVTRLQYHLPGEQNVCFRGKGNVYNVVDQEGINDTMFTMWFQANIDYPEANTLTYVQMPEYFVWDRNIKRWRIRGQRPAVGRMYFAHPSCGERYYLRLLLTKVCGPKSYEDIRTLNGIEYPTFKAACIAQQLISDNNDWHEALTEASFWAPGSRLRHMFCQMLLFNMVTNPEQLWNDHWVDMTDDFTNRLRRDTGNFDLLLSASELQNLGLMELEKILNRNGRSLKDFPPMPLPSTREAAFSTNRLLREATDYDRESERQTFLSMHQCLNPDQLAVFNTIVTSSASNQGGLYFIYGSGGTGKTYLYSTLISRFRSEGKIVISVASSGIASLLLPGGRTAHSQFRIPLSLHSDTFCPIDPRDDLSILIKESALIIWDEAPMLSRYAFESVDRTFKDILRHLPNYSSEKPFAGKLFVLGGDFRQILPVIPDGGRAETVGASLPMSALWQHCHVLHLRHNMRVTSNDLPASLRNQMTTFAGWLLDIGEGKLPTLSIGVGHDNNWIKIPDEFLIDDGQDALLRLIDFVYPNFVSNSMDPSYINSRAILAPTNRDVDELNTLMLSMFPGEMRTYYSADTVEDTEYGDIHPPELLHSMDLQGIPSHCLQLKVGVPVVLLRNIDHSMGLCNGTRMIISKMGDRVLEAKVVNGSVVGETVLISRLRLTPSTDRVPFSMSRTQFPVKVAFAMTINKSQGQTIKHLGVYLPKPVFTHGQLYVALSRVTSPSCLKVLIRNNDNVPNGFTKNVVYNEIFTNI